MKPAVHKSMINSKRKSSAALAVYGVETRPNGGCFFYNPIQSPHKSEFPRKEFL
jgi:hypothetical protein